MGSWCIVQPGLSMRTAVMLAGFEIHVVQNAARRWRPDSEDEALLLIAAVLRGRAGSGAAAIDQPAAGPRDVGQDALAGGNDGACLSHEVHPSAGNGGSDYHGARGSRF